MSRRCTRRTLGAVVATLAAGNVVRSTVLPDRVQLPFNLALGATVVGLTTVGGRVGANELGLSSGRLGDGLRLGAKAFAVISGVVAGAALIPRTRGYFDDERADVGWEEWLYDVVVDIPLGTVLVEELVFRGCVLALLLRLVSTRWAVVWASLLFGAWHVLVSWTSARDNETLADVAGDVIGLLGIIGGTVIATTIAGAVFCWLRLRSGSLVAPMLAHYAANAVTLTAGWLLAR